MSDFEDKTRGSVSKGSVSLSDKLEDQANILNKESIDNYISYDKPWWKIHHLRYLNFCVFLITLTSTNNGYDGSMLNGLQSLTVWQKKMGDPNGAVLGALSNGVIFGVMSIFPIASFCSDKFGRKPCIFIGQSFTILGAILQGVSTNYGFFLASRIIIGAGSGFATVSSPTLISEISFPTHRATCTTFYNVCWYLGAIVAAWVTYGTRTISDDYSWRIPSYLQGVLPLFQLSLVWMIPESPRYLVSKGKIDKAERVLRKYHTGNGTTERDDAFVQFELKEIEAALELEKLTSNSRYTDFVTLKNFRKRLFLITFTAVIMQLSGNGLVSYYLPKVLNSIGITSSDMQLKLNGCLMIYNFVICCVVASTVYLFKRRTMFITSTCMMCFFYVIWTILSAINQQRHFEDKSLGKGVLAMIFLYYLAYDIGANGLPFLYITEILPYSHRAKGMNIFQLSQQIIQVYNGFVNSIAMDAIEWKYYIVYCCILGVEVVLVILFYVETSGYTLEEVAKAFGDDPSTVLTELSTSPQKPTQERIEVV